jgi:hypothetical protein
MKVTLTTIKHSNAKQRSAFPTLKVLLALPILIIAGLAVNAVGIPATILERVQSEAPLAATEAEVLGENDVVVNTDPPLVVNADVTDGPIDLNDAEYRVVQAELQRQMNASDPRAALEWLFTTQRQDPEIARSCHGLAHETGRLAYKKYGNFQTAFSYQDDVCANGYVHGVIEAHFATVTDIYAEIQNICSAADLSCIHGIGHGIMYFKANDVPQALTLCESLGGSAQVIACSEAVFHENFETNSVVHTAKYLDEADPFGLCRNQPEGYKPNCYYYGGRYLVRKYQDDYAAAGQGCIDLADFWFLACGGGVGAVLVRQNINNPAFVAQQCKLMPAAVIPECFYGATKYFRVNVRSGDLTRSDFCAKLEDNYYTQQCNTWAG